MVTFQNENNKQCMLMGDCNMDFLRFKSYAKTNDFLERIFCHGFIPVISKPTRVTTSFTTLIDHMYINLITSSYHSGIIINDVSGKFAMFCTYEGTSKYNSQTNSKHRSFKTENMIKFLIC